MTPNPSESDLAAADLANCIECLTHAAEFQCPEYRHIIDTVLAALASAQRDTGRLRICVERFTMDEFEEMPQYLSKAREYIDSLMIAPTAMSKEPPL